jgi:acetyl esterase/lipase
MIMISVGYRLAPVDPFSKGPDDCIDAGEYLAKKLGEGVWGSVEVLSWRGSS